MDSERPRRLLVGETALLPEPAHPLGAHGAWRFLVLWVRSEAETHFVVQIICLRACFMFMSRHMCCGKGLYILRHLQASPQFFCQLESVFFPNFDFPKKIFSDFQTSCTDATRTKWTGDVRVFEKSCFV